MSEDPGKYFFYIAVSLACVLISALVITVIIPPLVSLTGGYDHAYSTGERTGVVTKLSKKGIIWKSWEGELLQAGLKGTPAGSVANIIGFNVQDEELIAKIEIAQKSGDAITIKYEQWFIRPIWIDNGMVVVEVDHDDNHK